MFALPSVFRIIIFSLTLSFLMLFALSRSSPAQNIYYPLISDFPLPKSVDLCDEPIPLERRHAWEMLYREFTIAIWNRAQVFLWLKRGGRYFPLIERKLAESSMPLDLKYLAVAESSLLPTVRSPKGAVGMWQFIAKTGRLNGLRVDRSIDERRSVQRSTEAAIRYLKSLKEIFGNWTLALAAYNCGEEALQNKIEEQGTVNYYRLNLPLETKRFIFRIAAIKIIMENPERYGYNIAPEHFYEPITYDTVPVTVQSSILISSIAQALVTDFKAIKEMNLHILGKQLPEGRYNIYVPSGFGPKMLEILSSPAYVASPSRKSDTEDHLAERTGVPVSILK
jgi:membrane-bound lytic murein transglycosylase D